MENSHLFKYLIISGLVCIQTLGYAENRLDKNNWQCSATDGKSGVIKNTLNTPLPKDAIFLEADDGTINATGTSILNGNVIIKQNDIVFNADQAKVNRSDNTVRANGNVLLSDSNIRLKSQRIDYNLKDRTGQIQDAEYEIGNEGVHGKSSNVKKVDANTLVLSDATFSSCPASADSWHLASKEIQLNNKTQLGTAKNVTFNVGKTPVFFFPWLKFPINDQRLSGFLTPSIRLQSNAGISIPYYLNIAPNYDARFELSTLNERGFELSSEFRYLSQRHSGQIEYAFVPEDKSFNNEKRDYLKITHKTKISDKTQINLDAENVSDVDYFDDFSTSLETSVRTSLQRRLEIIKEDGAWTASAAVEDYQAIDTNDRPYSKLPELKIGYQPKTAPNDIKYELNTELINFDLDNAVTGTRGDLKLKLSKKWGKSAWFFKPSLSLQNTYYSLNNNSNGPSSINRLLPTFTLDSGLFFDRTIKNGKYTQTLEPRLFYTHTPFKDQSDIPVFDTAGTNFAESNQLFLENRFTGKDRIADTNQLTFALTSRIQNRHNGTELFKTSIGQVFNFSDRKVTLPGGTIQTGRRSNLVLELTGTINDNFRISSTASLDSTNKSISSYDLRLNYQDDKDRIANLSFRNLETELEQVSVSGSLPLNNKWSFVGSIDHDLKNDRNLETLAGLEYNDCCWKSRLVVKRYLTSDNINYETPIFLEFELKGLGNIGTSATRQIKEKIYGYDDF